LDTITVLVAVSGALLAWLLNRSFVNPITLVLLIFAVVAYLPTLHLFGLYEFSDLAFRIVLAGIVFILVGFLLAFAFETMSRKSNAAKKHRFSKPAREVSYRLARVAAIVAIAVLIATRIAILAILLNGGGFAAVRNYFLGYGGNVGYADSLGELAGRIIVSPILFALTPIFVYGLVVGPINKRFTVLFVTAATLNLLTTGGRIMFVYAIVQFVVLYAIRRRSQVRLSRGKIATVVVMLAALVIAVTVSRGNAVLYETYTYFAIPLPLLSHWAEWADAAQVRTHGLAFTYGIVTLIANLADLLGSSIGGDVADAVAAPQVSWVELLPGRPFNAFVTMFYYFYLDFRIPGVILFSFLSGFIAQRIYGRAKYAGDTWSTLLFLLVLQGVVMSFVRWQPTDGAYVLAFVVLWILTRRRTREPNSQASRTDDGAAIDLRRNTAS